MDDLARKLKGISSLMNELIQEMKPGAKDLDGMLGRVEPAIEDSGIKSIEIEGEIPMEEEEEMAFDMEEEDESKMSPLKRLKKMGIK